MTMKSCLDQGALEADSKLAVAGRNDPLPCPPPKGEGVLELRTAISSR
jgi:hypothetical protein